MAPTTKEPDAPPPSYATATGSSTTSSHPQRQTQAQDSSHLTVPKNKNGIPAAARRSMEDEHRPLPKGWIRQFDDKEHHQFFVDTNADPRAPSGPTPTMTTPTSAACPATSANASRKKKRNAWRTLGAQAAWSTRARDHPTTRTMPRRPARAQRLRLGAAPTAPGPEGRQKDIRPEAEGQGDRVDARGAGAGPGAQGRGRAPVLRGAPGVPARAAEGADDGRAAVPREG